MDPLTQTLLGAVAGQALCGRRLGPAAALLGAAGGAIPDIDVFFHGAEAALPVAYHRHFTHSLLFIPAGGAAAALPFLLLGRWRRQWKLLITAAAVGCATHGLLDTMTSYGTHLLWPFSSRRLSWDLISIIDPVFTLVLAVGLVWSLLLTKAARPAQVALLVGLGYLGAGFVQHERAAAGQASLARRRGHLIERQRVMPTLSNLLVWRSIYQAKGVLYADAIRVPTFGVPALRRGSSLPVVGLADLGPQAAGNRRIRRVFAGFWDFADGYVARLPGQDHIIADMRYSLTPEGFDALWGVQITTDGPVPTVEWVYLATDRRRALTELWRDVRDPSRFRPLGNE